MTNARRPAALPVVTVKRLLWGMAVLWLLSLGFAGYTGLQASIGLDFSEWACALSAVLGVAVTWLAVMRLTRRGGCLVISAALIVLVVDGLMGSLVPYTAADVFLRKVASPQAAVVLEVHPRSPERTDPGIEYPADLKLRRTDGSTVATSWDGAKRDVPQVGDTLAVRVDPYGQVSPRLTDQTAGPVALTISLIAVLLFLAQLVATVAGYRRTAPELSKASPFDRTVHDE